jgi:nitrogen regulatory protein PII
VHGGHHKLELIVADELVEKVTSQIAENAWTGRERGRRCVGFRSR